MEVKRYIEPKNNFLQKVRKLCDRKKIVLVFDSVHLALDKIMVVCIKNLRLYQIL